MPQVRSARGEVVNFELLMIKQQLASAPAPKTVEDRRRFIDEKDGVRTKQIIEAVPEPILVPVVQVDALALALDAADISEKAAKKSK